MGATLCNNFLNVIVTLDLNVTILFCNIKQPKNFHIKFLGCEEQVKLSKQKKRDWLLFRVGKFPLARLQTASQNNWLLLFSGFM